MIKSIKYLFVFILIIQFVFGNKENSKTFNALPQGNLETVDISLGDYKCEFQYKATGGTNEEWMIHIADEGNQVICMIGRPTNPSSYLLFSDFSVKLENTKSNQPQKVIAELNDNMGSILMNDQYKIIGNKVVPDKNFGNNLVLLQLIQNK